MSRDTFHAVLLGLLSIVAGVVLVLLFNGLLRVTVGV